MNVFVAGGTGVLGQPTIERLVRAGHHVRALAHREASAGTLRALGAEPVAVDLFDAAGLRAALAGSDAVIHVATRIPPVNRAGRVAAWADNDRLRRDGTRQLVDAALAAGVSTLIYESIVLVYADGGDQWLDAEHARIAAPPNARSTLDAEREVARFSAAGRRGVSLRLGLLYSPTDAYTRVQLGLARRGVFPMFGRHGAYWPALWVDDAADALVAALGAPAGVYDVVDDRPLTRAELAAGIAAAFDRPLWHLPRFVWRLMLGMLAAPMGRSLRVSNRRFRAATGWQPSVPDASEGWRRIAAASAITASPRPDHHAADAAD